MDCIHEVASRRLAVNSEAKKPKNKTLNYYYHYCGYYYDYYYYSYYYYC